MWLWHDKDDHVGLWRLVPRVRVMVNLVASFPEYVLHLGDVTSVTDRQTDTIHIKVFWNI